MIKTQTNPKPAPAVAPSFYDGLKELLAQLDQPLPEPTRRPGRRTKTRAETTPVILHLYRSQIQWLDQYAALLTGARPDNGRLSRVEIVRGLLLGLAQHAIDCQMEIPADCPVQSERDLQNAIAAGLGRTAGGKAER